jgi:hypothetical protein
MTTMTTTTMLVECTRDKRHAHIPITSRDVDRWKDKWNRSNFSAYFQIRDEWSYRHDRSTSMDRCHPCRPVRVMVESDLRTLPDETERLPRFASRRPSCHFRHRCHCSCRRCLSVSMSLCQITTIDFRFYLSAGNAGLSCSSEMSSSQPVIFLGSKMTKDTMKSRLACVLFQS